MEQDGRSAANSVDGVVRGSVVQAGSIEGGVHFYGTNDATQPAVPVEPPEGWEELSELPVEVRSLLRAQVQVAQKLPYRLPGARRPSLATVYVRQDLGNGSEAQSSEQQRPTPILDSRGQLVDPPSVPVVRLSVRPPSRTVWEALDSDDHVLVTGGPGLGKSTLSLRVAADVAQRWLSSDAEGAPLGEPVVPLRLPARELAARLSVPFPEAVAESARVEYGGLLGAPVDAQVLGKRVVGCRWLLLVDGLDEVADSAERDRLVTVLASWASDAASPYRVVLTTRPIEGAALAPLQRIGAARYELQPFDEETLRHFADNWFGDADYGYRFVRQIRAAHLGELVRVPLLATIAAIIFQEHGDRPLPDNQYELYESYLKYLRTARPVSSRRFDLVRGPLLEHLGLVRLEADTSLVAAAQEWAVHHLPDQAADWQEELITYVAAVGPFTRSGNELRFLHHSFAEHLAATAKARSLPDRFEPEHADFVLLLHAARPEEHGHHARAVLLHHTRLHAAEGDRLIRWLHTGSSEQHLLAARLLASHVPAGDDVVEGFLITVRAWAMTTQYPGQSILSQASRAAHYPGIAEWLGDLMRDGGAPWESRVEAATALSTRLRGAQSSDAIAQLRQVVDDVAVPVVHRLAAAEALSECGVDEREASERGLRSVLSDPSATALNRRNAALVLAGFGGAPRVHAVEALTAMLDDRWTPDRDLVEAATGLVEIGVEFHERCSEVFRTILYSRTDDVGGLRDAAIGLASLGFPQLTEAASGLTKVITNRRVRHSARANAAEALAKLGPQHRAMAGEHLLAMSAEVNVDPGAQRMIASSLAQVGCHDHASTLLSAVLSDRNADAGDRLWAARALAGLGPEHEEEATQILRHLADNPAANVYVRAAALGRLAASGEPHRTSAVASLRGVLANRSADPTFRCHAATELTRLGPEFHKEVTEHLLEITSCQADPNVRVRAWRTLQDLGPEYHDRASLALLALAGPAEAASWESHRDFGVPTRSDTDDYDSLAQALIEVVHDPLRNGDARIYAAGALAGLGRRFHHTALESVIELLCSPDLPVDEFLWMTINLTSLGARARTELAKAVRAAADRSRMSAEAVCKLIEALERLDLGVDPEIVVVLRGIVGDDSVDSDVRGDAALALARLAPGDIADVVAVVLRNDDARSVRSWERQVRELAALGADVVPGLRTMLGDVEAQHWDRAMVAVPLAQLCPELRDEALAELRAQAGDEFLRFLWRTEAIRRLADLDADTLSDAIAYYRTVLDDERQPVRVRLEAAYQLVWLDDSFAETAFAAFRRFATATEFTAQEHAVAVEWLAFLGPSRLLEVAGLGLAVARDPTAAPSVRSRLAPRLWGKARVEVERSLLADRTGSPSERVGRLNAWEHPVLAVEAEAALRDVLAAVETSAADRVAAAAALAGISPRHVAEAASVLGELSRRRCAAAEARTELAKLGHVWRRQVLIDAERVVVDETLSWRRRVEAMVLMWDLTSNLSKQAVEYLRELVLDQRVAETQRVEMLYMLRKFDGLDRLRMLRDDEKTRPAIRWAAANRLREHAVEDRVAGARALDAIANDAACRTTLRWRAARDLMNFGERGRQLGIASLQVIIADEALPVNVRVDAARKLGKACPDLRGEMLRLFRNFQTAEKPLARLQVLDAIGQFDAHEGALALCEMAQDSTCSPGVRLRAATSMIELHRDYLEKAAAVARDVAHDDSVSCHVRVKAARALARWSDLCRAEGQSLLVELGVKWREVGEIDH